MPKLSVIIPVYNASAFLRETLDSILTQSFTDLELICVDGSAADNASDILREYKEKDGRVQVLSLQNPSAGEAANYALMHASGDYVHFLDAGDAVLPYTYEAVMNRALSYDLDILRFPALSWEIERETFISDPQNSISGVKSGEYDRLLARESRNPVFRGCCSMAAWAGFCRRTFLLEKDIRFNDPCCVNDRTIFRACAADADRSFFWACATNADRAMICRDRVVLHRVRPSDLTAERNIRDFESVLRSIAVTAERMQADGIGEDLQKAVLSVEFEEFARRYAAFLSAASPGEADQIHTISDDFVTNYKGFRAWRLREKYMDAQRRSVRATKADNGQKKAKTIEVQFEECAEPKVSVIVPVRNAQDHLNEALESLSAQYLKGMEFLLVNDGSTDGSMAIMQEYAALDKRFRILDIRDCPDSGCSSADDDSLNAGCGSADGYSPNAECSRADDDGLNAGCSSTDGDGPGIEYSSADGDSGAGRGRTINCGLDAARGEYIGILGPEDFVPANMYRDLHLIADLNRADFVMADFCRFTVNPNGTPDRRPQHICGSEGKSCYNRVFCPAEEIETPGFNAAIQSSIQSGSQSVICSGLYSRDFLNRCHIRCSELPGKSCRESLFLFQVFCRAERAYFTDKAYYMERQKTPGSAAYGPEEIDQAAEEYRLIGEFLEEDPARAEKFGGIFYAKKFSDFLHVFRQTARENQRDCLYRIRDEFMERPKAQLGNLPGNLPEEPQKGKIGDRESLIKTDLKFLNGEDRLTLCEIAADPDAYLDRLRVSVIMPIYNGERFLRETLDSLLNSHETTFELICVDDGSTDATPEILQEYEEKDDRVRVIRQENAGAGAARNAGIPYARGEYLAFLDADDIYEPDMLRRAYDRAHLTGADIVVVGSDKYIEETGEYIPMKNNIRRDLIPAAQVFSASDIRQNFFKAFVGWPWDKLFRADFVRETGLRFQKLRTTNDMLFVFASLAKAQRISVVNKVLAHHRRAAGTLSVTREKSWGCFYKALCALRDQLKAWELYEIREQDFINYCLYYCFWSLHSLRGEAYFKLYEKLKGEWLAELGVLVPVDNTFIARPASYFYNEGDYGHLIALLSLSAEDYLFYQKDLAAAQKDGARKKYNELQEKTGQWTISIWEQKTLRTRDKRQMQALQDQNRRAEKVNRQLTEKNDRLRGKNGRLTEKNDRLHGENARLTEKNDRLREKNGRLTEKNDRLTQKNDILHEKNTRLKAQIEKEKEELKKLKNSSIWKWGRVVTWPFRKIRRLFQRGQDK